MSSPTTRPANPSSTAHHNAPPTSSKRDTLQDGPTNDSFSLHCYILHHRACTQLSRLRLWRPGLKHYLTLASGHRKLRARRHRAQQVYVQLLQLSNFKAQAIQCKVEIDRTIYYCGLHSHVSIHNGRREYKN